MPLPAHVARRVVSLRRRFRHGDAATQKDVDDAVTELAPFRRWLRPKDKDEPLALCSARGRALERVAPRWLCHVLALRHRCSHVLLTCSDVGRRRMMVLQIRDWDKDDSAGHADISVGGHVSLGKDAGQTAEEEMAQELGLTMGDLSTFDRVGGYAIDEAAQPQAMLFNSEYRELFVGSIKPRAMSKVHFSDGEVAGLLLLPADWGAARTLLRQLRIPLASGLRLGLPYYSKRLAHPGV